MNRDFVTDRAQPQSIEAEQAVRGAILTDGEALLVAMERLAPDDFYRAAHQRRYEAMLRLNDENEPIDLITLTTDLQNHSLLEEIGGVGYLTELANAVPTASNVGYYAEILEEKAMLRRLIRAATQIVSSGYASAEDVNQLISDAEQKILEISNRRGDGFILIRDVLMDVFERVEFLYNHKGGTTGIPSGFPDLDKMTAGFQANDL